MLRDFLLFFIIENKVYIRRFYNVNSSLPLSEVAAIIFFTNFNIDGKILSSSKKMTAFYSD
ncbi:hypothetical protein ACRRTK_004678 [Alexandromys fortis]